jgi:bis(5'-nucleosyl)-tetraphosphatase (symmetrical)
MAIYAIGDVQGCYDELVQLLDQLRLDPAADQVWFVGDLVNRGPESLEVLRLVKSMPDIATVVLGNHDLHLLAGALNPAKVDAELAPILAANDADELIHWLRHQSMAVWNPALNTLMAHAGIWRDWDAAQTMRHAGEVEQVLRGPGWKEFLAGMYGRQPDAWSDELSGLGRLRFITNCLTRSRFCFADGRLEFASKGPPDQPPAGLIPWFDVPGRAGENVRIVCGHWSAAGLVRRDNLLMIDTGCVWGRELTAVRLDGDPDVSQVAAFK